MLGTEYFAVPGTLSGPDFTYADPRGDCPTTLLATADLFSGAIPFGLCDLLESPSCRFQIQGPFCPGPSQIIITDNITSLTGIPLDGDGDGVPGGDYVLTIDNNSPMDRNADGSLDFRDVIAMIADVEAIDLGNGDFNWDFVANQTDNQDYLTVFANLTAANP